MEKVLEFTVPVRLRQSKNKWFYLNMNNYRNAHYRTLTSMKDQFTDIIKSMQLKDKIRRTIENPIRVTYKYYPVTNGRYDKMNVASVVDKFLNDALVRSGIIKDDNYTLVEMPLFIHMHPDSQNPRIEVEVWEL